MRQRLQGGRFRWLNETLYTSDGAAALEMIQQQPELMEQYHEGEGPCHCKTAPNKAKKQ